MKIRKLYIALCGSLFAVQMVSAQQNMFLVDNNGEINAISVSTMDYATFNTNSKLFTITNDGIEGIKTDLITASCSVRPSAASNIKTLSIIPEVGVCYTKYDRKPTIGDACLSLGSELKSYTFSLSGLTSGTTYYFCVYVKLARAVFYGDVTKAKTLGAAPVDNSKTINGHQFVDLGLPSGLLWAETNLGAEEPADAGASLAWGETEAKSDYNWDTYKYGTSRNITKYNSSDGKTTLDKEDDAAYVNWGPPCRMPTDAEFNELRNTSNCTWTSTSIFTSDASSINGFKVTSVKNGNSIFLPASGLISGGNLYYYGLYGLYWSSSLPSDDSDYALHLELELETSGIYYRGRWWRYDGLTVRPVAEP